MSTMLQNFRHGLLQKSLRYLRPTSQFIACKRESSSFQKEKLPSHAEYVIVGGGAVGCSTAYHLAKLGVKDVVLLEQGSLGCGTTWHAAGLLGTMRGTRAEVEVSKYGVEFYSNLAAETGFETGFKRCGSLNVGTSKDRATFMRRLGDRARQLGVEFEYIGANEAVKLHPQMRGDDIELAVWIPGDGACNPSDVVQSMMKGAVSRGAKFFEKVQVTNVESQGRYVTGVDTSAGKISCDKFINCGGLWARELGQKSDPPVNVPLHACEHFYIVTKPLEGVDIMAPVVRDYNGQLYAREFSGGIMGGSFEYNAIPTFHDGVPEKFEFQLLQENWDHFMPSMECLMHRFPALETAEIRTFLNGPESFTPDNKSITTQSTEYNNYWIAAGMSSAGIANAPGFGKMVSELAVYGESEIDGAALNVRRFYPGISNKGFLRDKASDSLSYHYELFYPRMEFPSCRNIKNSPLHGTLESLGAKWGTKSGWEVPIYFSDDAAVPNTFGCPGWLKNVQAEMETCEKGVGLFDLTMNSKFKISSKDSSSLASFVNTGCSKDLSDIPVNSTTEVAYLNKKSGVEFTADVLKLSDDCFLFNTSPNQHMYFTSYWQSLIDSYSLQNNIAIEDCSNQYAVIGLMGPNSEDLISRLLPSPFTIESQEKGTFQVADIGYACNVKLLKHSDSVWTLMVPAEFCQGLLKFMLKHGEDLGVGNVGHYALDSIRVQNMVPAFGVELGARSSAGIKHFLDCEKGKHVIQSLSSIALHKLEISLPSLENWPWGGEPVSIGDEVVSNLTSIGFTETENTVLGLTFLDLGKVDRDSVLRVQVGGEFYDASIVAKM